MRFGDSRRRQYMFRRCEPKPLASPARLILILSLQGPLQVVSSTLPEQQHVARISRRYNWHRY